MIGEHHWPEGSKDISLKDRPMETVRKYFLNEAERRNPVVEKRRQGFDWKKSLDSQKKPFLEVAGPTPRHDDYDFINFRDYGSRLITTNVIPSKDFPEARRNKLLEINAAMDGENLAVKDNSLGAVFISSFRIRDFESRQRPKPENHKPDLENTEHVRKVAKEVFRALDEGGMLVWLRLETEDDLRAIEEAGFIPVFSQDLEREGIKYEDDYGFEKTIHRYGMVYVKETPK